MSDVAITPHKMLFNTGVRPCNNPNAADFDSENREWVGGTMHIAYYLDEAPPENWRVKWLCNEVQDGELSMPVVGGGMMSEFVIFREV